MYHNIVCPYDHSEFAERALEKAARMAADKGGKLFLVRVLVNPFLFDGGSHLLSTNLMATDLMEKIREEATGQMQEIKDQVLVQYPDLEVEMGLTEGNDIGEAIMSEAENRNADLIVMGSHGRKGIKKWMMGSVADYVLREAKCPVLIVK
ncbi:MAG: universal stress protein [Saprospiraceae bacterium]|nr:universal stress protein [Saprospiraceae bacterium]MBK7811162.1 universal stress protein [Saprospiraceae bacterium]MBK9631138.1 universal stress protein [Saprospiraceae bacterium]